MQDFAQNTAPDGDDTSDASAANALDDVIHSLIVGVDPFFLASSTAIPREARLQSADPREDIRPPRATNLLI